MPDGELRGPHEPMPPLVSDEPFLLGEIVSAEPALPRPPHPGFWWAVLWCLGFLGVTQILPGILGVVLLLVLLARSGKQLNLEQLGDSEALLRSPEYAQAMMPAMLVSQFLSILMAWLVIRLMIGKDWPRILALRWPGLAHLLLALIGLPGLMVVSMGVDGLAKEIFPSLIDLDETVALFGKWPWPIGVLIIGLGPGIGEELWCRGFLGRGLVGRHGVVGGILLTSLLFGLIHLEPRQIAYAMVIGVLLHLSYLATRSLLVPIILHAANNTLSVLAMHVSGLAGLDVPATAIPWYVYLAAVVLLAAVGWVLFKNRARLVDVPGAGSFPWRPMFAGAEYPPVWSSTRVIQPAPNGASWVVALGAALMFAGAVVAAR